MVGQLFEIRGLFSSAGRLSKGQGILPKPPLSEQLKFFRRHAKLAIAFKNEKWAMTELRKHFTHFVRGIPHAAQFRDRLIRVESLAEMEEVFAIINEQ